MLHDNIMVSYRYKIIHGYDIIKNRMSRDIGALKFWKIMLDFDFSSCTFMVPKQVKYISVKMYYTIVLRDMVTQEFYRLVLVFLLSCVSQVHQVA